MGDGRGASGGPDRKDVGLLVLCIAWTVTMTRREKLH